jgi:hypothetical protein
VKQSLLVILVKQSWLVIILDSRLAATLGLVAQRHVSPHMQEERVEVR